MSSKTRIYRGKRYELQSTFKTRKSAQTQANIARRAGDKAHIVKNEDNRYELYVKYAPPSRR